jgi:hypothetical protein
MSTAIAVIAAQRGAKRIVEAAKRGREKVRSLRKEKRS